MFNRTIVASTVKRPNPALGVLLLLLALFGLTAPTAHAATLTVMSINDGVANASLCPGIGCRLRDAIAKANPGDTITFNFSGTILLTQGQLTINKDLTIIVNGPVSDVTVDAQSNSRVFDITGSAVVNISGLGIANGTMSGAGLSGGAIIVTNGATLNLSNVIVQDSKTTGLGANGGAIQNDGKLNISNFAFFANNSSAGNGGAIANDGTLTINGSINSNGSQSVSFFNNSTSGDGGAIYNNGVMGVYAASFNLSQAVASGGVIVNHAGLGITRTLMVNSTALLAGAIQNYSGATLTIEDSTIGDSTATNNSGGISNAGDLTIRRSILRGNRATGGPGGGIENSGILTMINSTLSGNSATEGGGGIYVADPASTTTLNNVTLTKNTADSDNSGSGNGGGIRVVTGTVHLRNTLIAGNFDTPSNGGSGAIHPDCSGILDSEGYNLLRIDDGCTGLTNGVGGDLVGTFGSPLNAFLAALAENGGPTQTHALLPASPAIDAGNPAAPGSGGFACAKLDQRSYPRGAGGNRCDIGAYERVFLQFLPLIAR